MSLTGFPQPLHGSLSHRDDSQTYRPLLGLAARYTSDDLDATEVPGALSKALEYSSILEQVLQRSVCVST